MVIMIHNLANTYKMLPSEVLDRATTFDLYTLNLASGYTNYQQNKLEGKNPISKVPNQEEMIEMLKKVRSK
jgi:hypothetical protein